jgi:hypothetical protein
VAAAGVVLAGEAVSAAVDLVGVGEVVGDSLPYLIFTGSTFLLSFKKNDKIMMPINPPEIVVTMRISK